METMEKQILRDYVRLHDEYQEIRGAIDEHGGKKAKELRKEAALSLRKFAAELGVSPSYLSKIENNHIPLAAGMAKKMLEKTE